eukprot:2700644-Amphidinium_carterae.2
MGMGQWLYGDLVGASPPELSETFEVVVRQLGLIDVKWPQNLEFPTSKQQGIQTGSDMSRYMPNVAIRVGECKDGFAGHCGAWVPRGPGEFLESASVMFTMAREPHEVERPS